MTPESSLRPCACRIPAPGPMYWNWRCLKCSGVIDHTTLWEYAWVLLWVLGIGAGVMAVVAHV